jgi:diacylglycerol kinase (ATP)
MLDIARLVRAARYSLSGLHDAVWRHTSFRQELLAGVVLTPIAIWLGDNGVERALLLSSLMLVLIVELVNSAVETVVDRVGTEPNELSGRAKDLGSAAVLLSLLNVGVVWGFVLLG